METLVAWRPERNYVESMNKASPNKTSKTFNQAHNLAAEMQSNSFFFLNFIKQLHARGTKYLRISKVAKKKTNL